MNPLLKHHHIPNTWSWSKAQDCIDVRDGTHDSPKYIDDGYPLVTSKNLVNGKIDFTNCSYISQEDHDAISKRSLVNDGDILYAMIGTIGNPVIVKKEFDFSVKNVALFKFNDPKVLNKYVYYFLESDLTKRQFESRSRGGTQKFVSLTNIRELMIPLPPLAEQLKIAAILDAADSLRQKDQQLIEHYTALSQSLFLEMFGDPVGNPMGFTKSTVGEQCTVKGGKRVPKGETLVQENTGYPYIKAGNIKAGKVTTEKLEYLTADVQEKLKRYIVDKGDVCITVVGANIGDIGVVPESLHHANLTENANKILINDQKILSNLYLSFYLRMGFIQQQIKKRTMAVGVPKLALFRIQQLDLLLPPIGLQNEFIDRINSIEQQKQQAQASLEKSEALFDSLLQRAFKGELTH